jgi:alpha-beta hydrolase superfamily lysophospholipase
MSTPTVHTAADPGLVTSTRGLWFGPQRRPALGWLSAPVDGVADSGVVVAPPHGYPYWCSHRTLRTIAEVLAADGHQVLRIDYDGTGDSAGDQWDSDRLAAWRATLAGAVRELRGLGASRITLLGVRLGATLALLDARELEIDRVLAWQPVVTGRRYAKELRLLSQAVPPGFDALEPAGTRVVAGNVFSSQTLSDIGRLDVAELQAPPARSTLVVDDLHGSSAAAAEHLRAIGAEVEYLQLPGGELALETPPEFATVPAEIVTAIRAWLGAAGPHRAPSPPRRSTPAVMAWRGGEVQEEIITLPSAGHVGIVTSPVSADAHPTTLVLLNPGSETHVGPGRAWVELARDLALQGRRTLRVDFLGWGESPDAGRAPGRPYDAVGIEDTVSIVRDLRAAGHPRIAVCGLCASAWIALAAARTSPADGVIALNPQLYWKPGDPVEIDWDLIRARRAGEIARIQRGERFRMWSILDTLGSRPPAARWLDELANSSASVHLIFAEGDDGLQFLNERLSRRIDRLTRRGRISLRELPDIDHPMHLAWLRPRVAAALSDALAEIDTRPRASGR